MKLWYLGTAFSLFIIAADSSGIQGEWAHTLGVPFSGFAQESFWLVPIVVLLPCILPRQFPLRLTNTVCGVIVLGLIYFPIAVFSLGTQGITFSGELPAGVSTALQAELGFPVLIVYSGQSHIYFPRTHDPSLVRDALYRHKGQPKPKS